MRDLWGEWSFIGRWRERRELRRRIAEELDFHFEQGAADLTAHGMTGQEAYEEAARRLGDRSAVASECASVAGESDLAVSGEVRRRRRLTLAAAAAVAPPALLLLFLSHHVRELPVADPSSLSITRNTVPEAFALASSNPFEVAAFRRLTRTWRAPAGPTPAAGFVVSQGFFALQGVTAAMGSVDDLRPGCVVLSHRAWANWTEADPEIVGKRLDGSAYAGGICAVMSPDYWFLQRAGAFWIVEDRDRKDAGTFLLVRNADKLRRALKLPKTVALSDASRTQLRAAATVCLAALLLLAILGVAETFLLARTLGEHQRPLGRLVRNYAFLLAKALPLLATLATLWTVIAESPALAPVGYFAGVWSLFGFYLFALLSTAVVRFALVDQRSRCPICQRTLAMPVDLGIPGSILFHLPAVEYVCAFGHGTLYVPEPTSEGVRQPAWRATAGWWNDLLGAGASAPE